MMSRARHLPATVPQSGSRSAHLRRRRRCPAVHAREGTLAPTRGRRRQPTVVVVALRATRGRRSPTSRRCPLGAPEHPTHHRPMPTNTHTHRHSIEAPWGSTPATVAGRWRARRLNNVAITNSRPTAASAQEHAHLSARGIQASPLRACHARPPRFNAVPSADTKRTHHNHRPHRSRCISGGACAQLKSFLNDAPCPPLASHGASILLVQGGSARTGSAPRVPTSARRARSWAARGGAAARAVLR
jgi:hypothetical protein